MKPPRRGAATAALLLLPVSAAAQQAPEKFDRSRAWIADSVLFVPFRVTSTVPLKDALENKRVENATNLLVLERGKTRLALVTSQMAYHHVAQGEIAGEPWMVSF
ncbi:MAG: hypothetical protein ACRENB_04470 [Gemmatimonadales bacterium]